MAKPIKKPSQPFYDNTNSGVLFDNEANQRKGKKDPDWRGSFVDIDGNEHWLAGWYKEHKDYGTYISLKATPKEAEEEDEDEEPKKKVIKKKN